MTTCLLCSCNDVAPLSARDSEYLQNSLAKQGIKLHQHRHLCRGELPQFLAAAEQADTQEIIVGCTQEQPLFTELAEHKLAAEVALRFVNLRDVASAEHPGQIAALLADSALPRPPGVQAVNYQSDGHLLIIGPAAAAIAWADQLSAQISVSVLLTMPSAPASNEGAAIAQARRYPVKRGWQIKVAGWLGAFQVSFSADNPIDLESCVQCGACAQACPEGAISALPAIDLSRCKNHGDCLSACQAIGAISFERMQAPPRQEQYDLILDLGAEPCIRSSSPPQGYQAPGSDPLQQALAAMKLVQMQGEFSKPRYFAYDAGRCAHGRNGRIGCDACRATCSTAAISSVFKDGKGHIQVTPELCMGCGGCATACPTGAIRYNYPDVPYLSLRLKTMLQAFYGAGGESACIVLHSGGEVGNLISALQHSQRFRSKRAPTSVTPGALPGNLLLLEIPHVASTGLDLWLAALAYGARRILLLANGEEAAEYLLVLRQQAKIAEAIMQGLGYAADSVIVLEPDSAAALGESLQKHSQFIATKAVKSANATAQMGTFKLLTNKRESMELALDHLVRHAPRQDLATSAAIALPATAAFGRIQVDAERCTLCLACVSACPAQALHDNKEQPQLSFVEQSCVQCGICAQTCPEQAITLEARLSWGEQRTQKTVLARAEPALCTSCGKAFGTANAVQLMLQKLAAHSAFQGAAAARLGMCNDCRVVDMIQSSDPDVRH